MNYSKQREQILNYVKSLKIHPTAYTVYNELKNKIPNLSLGTVYRNLDVLAKNGMLKRIKISDDKDRFDGDISSHLHAICVKCGQVFDVDCNDFKQYSQVIEDKLECQVLSCDVMFNILCSKCKNNI